MAFSFTSAGFGGFGVTDPTDKTKKVKTGSTEKRVATKEGYDRVITSTYKTTTTTPGGGKLPYAGSIPFQKAFAKARSKGLSTFNWSPTPGTPGKSYSTDLYKPRPAATAVDFTTESRTAPGLRFTAGSPNITAKPLLTPKKMNGGPSMNPPKTTPKMPPPRTPIKIPTPNLQFIPDAFEAVGQAFSNLRLFRKGRGRGRSGRGCGFCGKKLLKTFKR